MFVRCGGMASSLTSSLLMSTFSRTTGAWTVTGLGMSDGTSDTGRGLANVNISTNARKSPGYSRRTSPGAEERRAVASVVW